MILKERPSDFRVEEVVDLPVGRTGKHGVYLLAKERRNTLDVIAEVARIFDVPQREVSYGGLKDYEGVTRQYITVPRGPRKNLTLKGASVTYLGRSPEPLAGPHLRGNRFDVRVRNLSVPEAERFRESLEAVARTGVPNYFDDQRFGSVRSGGAFPYRAILAGRWEDALRLLFASPAPHDTRARQRRAGRIRDAWGNWGACLSRSSTPQEKKVFGHLRSNPGDLAGALARVDRPYLLLLAFSYQSFLFNELLAVEVTRAADGAVAPLPYRAGRLCFARAGGLEGLAALAGGTVALPGAGAPEGAPDPALAELLNGQGLTLAELGRPTVKSVQLKWEERPGLFRPEEWEAFPPEDDRHHRRRRSVRVRMKLPRNAYATVVFKAAAAHGGLPPSAAAGPPPSPGPLAP